MYDYIEQIKEAVSSDPNAHTYKGLYQMTKHLPSDSYHNPEIFDPMVYSFIAYYSQTHQDIGASILEKMIRDIDARLQRLDSYRLLLVDDGSIDYQFVELGFISEDDRDNIDYVLTDEYENLELIQESAEHVLMLWKEVMLPILADLRDSDPYGCSNIDD